MRERWDDVAGQSVRSLVLGAGPPLVVVPGLGALGYLRPTLERCAAWSEVHLLDVPGFGRWRTAGRPADLTSVAAVVAEWVRSVPGEPVVLVGHSTGAQVALRAAVTAPEAVGSLVLGGVTFPPELRTLRRLAARVLTVLPHEAPGELPAVLPEYLRGARRMPQLLRTAMADRPEDAVRRVLAPVTVLRGERDGLCPPEWAARLASLAKAGRVAEVPGAHNAVWTHPEEVAAALRGQSRW